MREQGCTSQPLLMLIGHGGDERSRCSADGAHGDRAWEDRGQVASQPRSPRQRPKAPHSLHNEAVLVCGAAVRCAPLLAGKKNPLLFALAQCFLPLLITRCSSLWRQLAAKAILGPLRKARNNFTRLVKVACLVSFLTADSSLCRSAVPAHLLDPKPEQPGNLLHPSSFCPLP